MKKYSIIALAAVALLSASCDDMLDKSPRDRFTNSSDFWNVESQVESYSNTFYENFVGYGTGTGYGWFYFKSLSDDQANPSFDNWEYTTVPSTSTYWSDPYTEVRRADYMIQGMETSTLAEATKAKYMAIARLVRGWQYYELVRRYGDVQWIAEPILDVNDESVIYGARDDRDEVMDKVMEDINYAIENIGTSSDKCEWSKNLALAMKSEIALFEGTYCKYRTAADNGKAADASRANTYLNYCVDASQQLMSAGYSLTDEYGEVYNSLDLTSCKEVIFMRNYEKDVQAHSTLAYTASSSQQRGITKDAFDAFLFLDGKPKASTSYDTSDKPELTADGNNYSIEKLLAVRDKRLSVLLDPMLAFKGFGYIRTDGVNTGTHQMTSSTGYNIRKYDNLNMENDYRENTGKNYTDAPLYWLAVIYLNYAEAKAELGTITQTDLDNSVNKLMTRAGLPGITTSPAADPANNMGVSNLLWEIRRCRRCELMTDNWVRYWDLVRWHQLELLDQTKYPNTALGANLSVVPSDKLEVEVNTEGYAIPHNAVRGVQYPYSGKYYLFPIPSNQITLSNGATTQNPGWN